MKVRILTLSQTPNDIIPIFQRHDNELQMTLSRHLLNYILTNFNYIIAIFQWDYKYFVKILTNFQRYSMHCNNMLTNLRRYYTDLPTILYRSSMSLYKHFLYLANRTFAIAEQSCNASGNLYWVFMKQLTFNNVRNFYRKYIGLVMYFSEFTSTRWFFNL